MSTEQEQYDTWLLDMDGVLMHEETALQAVEAKIALRFRS